MMWAAIEDVVPFPALTNLTADGGNGASLENLGLPFGAIARNGGYVAENTEAAIKQQLCQMIQISARLKFGTNVPGDLVFQSLCTAPDTAALQRLEFAEILAIPVSGRPSRLREKYYPLSNNFRTLSMACRGGGASTVDIAYAGMIIAVLCPNFVHVDLPPRLRRDFGREIARGLRRPCVQAICPYKSVASSIRELGAINAP
ncbi:hypothetical protein IWW39_003493 [Coemansia spiralis]|uniref:Uncharacterized protein n=1 Tax=Coemansia spiralis TaxID=417178 RepID=A0A9W8L2K1_9FUNG|nr:hypothetical protein IWW39_003493 [Coemansia spiralis]